MRATSLVDTNLGVVGVFFVQLALLWLACALCLKIAVVGVIHAAAPIARCLRGETRV